MNEVLKFPLPKDPRKRGERLMRLAKQEKNSVRRAELFNQASRAFEMCKKPGNN